MFALNLITVASEVDWFHPSSLGWMVIVITWSIIGALWMAASLLTERASQSNSGPDTKPLSLVLHNWRIKSKHRSNERYSRLRDISER